MSLGKQSCTGNYNEMWWGLWQILISAFSPIIAKYYVCILGLTRGKDRIHHCKAFSPFFFHSNHQLLWIKKHFFPSFKYAIEVNCFFWEVHFSSPLKHIWNSIRGQLFGWVLLAIGLVMCSTSGRSESFSGNFFRKESKERDYFTHCHKGEKTKVLEPPVAMGPASWRYLAWKMEGDIHKE